MKRDRFIENYPEYVDPEEDAETTDKILDYIGEQRRDEIDGN